MRQANTIRSQRGVALIIVLMVVAMVSIIATEMGGRLQLQIKRAANIKDNNQAYWYAMGAEQFARKSIMQLIEQGDGVVNMAQPWHQEFTYPIGNGGIQAQLEDMQTCFNVNALAGEETNPNDPTIASPILNAFRSLMRNADLQVDDYTIDVFSDSLADWMDSDSNMRINGAEDADYEALTHPYLAANDMMASKSELRLVNGADPKWLPKLLPLVCVIPGSQQLVINVNTVDAERAAVLAAVTGLSLTDAQSEISRRDETGYDDVQEFFQQPEIAALEVGANQPEWFSVNTNYFKLTTKTRYNEASFQMISLFQVDAENNTVTVIRREFGGVL